ncbi:hypothetical protein BJF93_21965 [Xaviernesmea oryzae]|uniref:DUF3618 domain-containing protein n=1 Tax=Xaviernesmea oryzae TaxID=464029 RepID=A0A1Q9B3T0_9HYPH|nr:hypothetical protein [Xaviernesmea oryzae]OLP62712.1 hypothetical protein BJF93_21965 [Xaviernesmea oryzae]SEM38349.1 hypothetical protein SAMN04487976_13612 [Xaviernesmea oryzae]
MTELGQPIPKAPLTANGTPLVDDALDAIDKRDDAARADIEALDKEARRDDLRKTESEAGFGDRAAIDRANALTVIDGNGDASGENARREADLAALREELANIATTLGRLSKAAINRAGEKVGEAGTVVRDKAKERPYMAGALVGLASLAVYLVARPPRHVGAQLQSTSKDLFHRLAEMEPRNFRRRSWF